MAPSVSLQTVAYTFDSKDALLASAISKSPDDGVSVLSFVLSADGEIPKDGLIVTVNSNIQFREYFAFLAERPFNLGGEFVGAVFNSKGEATGFKYRLTQPKAIINLRPQDNSTAISNDVVKFSIEPSKDYSIDAKAGSSQVVFYENLAQVPAPSIIPEVKLSISNNVLNEATGNSTTLTFNLSAPPPKEGVLVYIKGDRNVGFDAGATILSEFDLFKAKVTGGAFPTPDSLANGFYFKITEQTATLTLSAFKDEDIEGIKDITLSLQEVPGYKIAKDAGSVKLNIVDDASSQIQVSFTTSPALLIESEKTVSVHTFNLSAIPPKEGLVVSVVAPNISEFDLSGIKVEGGEIARLTSTGFDLKITARTAIIRLPVANDGKAEGLETATFTLQDAPTYQVNPNAIVGSFKIVDTPAQAPVLTVREPNDIIAKAVDTNLNPENSKVSFTSTLDFGFRNSYDDGKGGVIYVDATEDVDMYKVTLKKGDRIYVDTDSNQFGPGRKVDPTLRIFDATGKELAENVDGGAPDEIFAAKWDAYLDFTAPADGDYYVGVSLYNNSSYDPNKPASGSGGDEGEDGTDPEGYGPGEYKLNINLNQPFIAPPTAIKPGNGTGPAISLFSVSGTYRNDFGNLDFGIANQNVFESVPEGLSSAVSLVLTTNGEIPASGLEVFVTANTALSNYFDVGAGKPFTRGGQFLDAVYDNTGKVIGFNFRMEQSFATIVLNPVNRETPETNGPESVTFSVVESVGYKASNNSSSTITFGDKLPEMKLAVMPNLEASLSVDKTELIESQETNFTITLSLNQKPPQGGIQVYVSGNAQDFLNEFSIFKAQFKGGIPVADGAVSGFYFQMFEQTATITLPVFNSTDIIEGIEQFTLSLVPDNNPNGYTVNSAKGSATITIKDTPDSKIQVSLSTEPKVLIESEKTVSVHNFNLSANPPKDGLTVKVNAPNLSEFDLKGIAVKGGEITAVRADGFDLKITAKTATISLPVADDGKAEGLEKATFTLAPGNGYQVNPSATNGTFTIVDTPDQAPSSTNELNDTLATAIRTGLSSTNPKVTFEGQMEQHTTGRGANQIKVDITEDVDMYKVDLKAGAKLVIDIDATEIGSKFQFAQIRVFDANGKELAKTGGNSFQAAPDEIFSVFNDPYLEFTPEKAGTYYVGISQIGNDYYDPKVAGSGSGWVFPSADILPGKYKLNLSLSEPVPSKTPAILYGNNGDDVLSAGDGDNIIYAGEGNNTITTGSGNDILYGGAGNDIISAGSGNNIIYAGEGNNKITTGAGKDLIHAGAGNDIISSGAGDDLIYAGEGKNTIDTGAGLDQVYSGSGADIFKLNKGDGFVTINGLQSTDKFSLGTGLNASDLKLTVKDGDTIVSAGDDQLAVLKWTQLNSLNLA
jgi:Ca2+-binding RTX toxin-like protein